MRDKNKAILTNKEWKEIFQDRLLEFSVKIIILANILPKTPAGFAIASQLIRAATSVGANFGEAQDASSSKDFLQKLNIALREAKETFYWLRVIEKVNLLPEEKINDAFSECKEIIAVLVKSVKSAKTKIL